MLRPAQPTATNIHHFNALSKLYHIKNSHYRVNSVDLDKANSAIFASGG